MAKEYKSFTTEKGTAMWAKVNTQVDVYEGKETGYTINVYFDEVTTAKLKKQALDIIEAAKESGEYVNKKTGKPLQWREPARTPIKTDDNDKEYVVFKTKHTKVVDGEEVKKMVPLFDAYGKPMDAETAIGNGSIVKINYTPTEYHLSSDNNGVKFFLNAIQVIDLKTFSGGADGSSFGFGVEATNEYFGDDLGNPEDFPE